jgi:hypothetical protein
MKGAVLKGFESGEKVCGWGRRGRVSVITSEVPLLPTPSDGLYGRSSLSENSVRCRTRHPNTHRAHRVRTDNMAPAHNMVQEAAAGQAGRARPLPADKSRRKWASEFQRSTR